MVVAKGLMGQINTAVNHSNFLPGSGGARTLCKCRNPAQIFYQINTAARIFIGTVLRTKRRCHRYRTGSQLQPHIFRQQPHCQYQHQYHCPPDSAAHSFTPHFAGMIPFHSVRLRYFHLFLFIVSTKLSRTLYRLFVNICRYFVPYLHHVYDFLMLL